MSNNDDPERLRKALERMRQDRRIVHTILNDFRAGLKQVEENAALKAAEEARKDDTMRDWDERFARSLNPEGDSHVHP